LVQHFAARQATRLGRSARFDAGAVQLLASYPWPGNVRELANIMERLAILAAGDVVTADDVARVMPGDGAAPLPAPSEGWSDVALAEALDGYERTLIARALSAGARQRGGRGPQACDGPRQPVSPDCAGSASSRRGTWRDDTTRGPSARVIARRRAPRPHPGGGTPHALSAAPPTRMPVMRVLVLVVLGALGPAVAAAQDTAIVIQPESAGVMVPPPELPHAVAEDAVRRYNAATTTRLVGRSRLPHGNEWRGDVAVRNGVVVVAGRVEGTLLVINGDAILDSSAW